MTRPLTKTLTLVLAAALVGACSSDDPPAVVDAGADAGDGDGGAGDAPSGPDAGPDAAVDAPAPDAARPPATWVRRLALGTMGSAEAIAALGPDSVIVTGTTVAGPSGSRDLWALRLDGQGELVWQTVIGDPDWNEGTALVVRNDKVFVYGNTTVGTGLSGWALTLDGADGSATVQRSVGTLESNSFVAALGTPKGAVLAGLTREEAPDGDLWLLELDTGSEVLWQRRYGDEALDERGMAIARTPAGGYVVAGTSSAKPGDADGWLLFTDAAGNVEGQYVVAGPALDRFDAVVAAGDGVVAVGTTKSFGAGEADVWAVKLGFDGKIAWQKAIGGAEDDWGSAAIGLAQGGLVIAGRSKSFSKTADDTDAFVARIDDAGALVWSRTLGFATDYDSFRALIEQGPLVVAAGVSEAKGAADYLIARLTSAAGDVAGGCDALVDVAAASTDSAASSKPTAVAATPTGASSVETTFTPKASQGKATTVCPID